MQRIADRTCVPALSCHVVLEGRHLRAGRSMVGVVDEDPAGSQHPDLKASYRGTESAEGLRLLARRGDTGRTLIIICPRLEDWLIHRAKTAGVKPDDYGLPSDPDRLHSIPHYEQRQGFRRFLGELMGRDAKGLGILRRWVHEGQ